MPKKKKKESAKTGSDKILYLSYTAQAQLERLQEDMGPHVSQSRITNMAVKLFYQQYFRIKVLADDGLSAAPE